MTWDQLIKKIREGLTESGARLRVLGGLLADVYEAGDVLDHEETELVVTGLTLAVSDLHSIIEHVVIGLDAVVGVYREANTSQEVKGDGRKGM